MLFIQKYTCTLKNEHRRRVGNHEFHLLSNLVIALCEHCRHETVLQIKKILLMYFNVITFFNKIVEFFFSENHAYGMNSIVFPLFSSFVHIQLSNSQQQAIFIITDQNKRKYTNENKKTKYNFITDYLWTTYFLFSLLLFRRKHEINS